MTEGSTCRLMLPGGCPVSEQDSAGEATVASEPSLALIYFLLLLSLFLLSSCHVRQSPGKFY